MKWLKTCLCCMTVILVGVASAVTRASARTVNEVPSPTQASCPGFCMICAVFELQYMVTPAGPGLPGNDEEATSMCGHHVPCSFECRMTLQSEIRSVAGLAGAVGWPVQVLAGFDAPFGPLELGERERTSARCAMRGE